MPHDLDDLLHRLKALERERGTFENLWQDLAQIHLPRRADFTIEQTPGARRTENQFDGTPMQAARALAASIDGLLKPKTSPWFKIETDDDDLNQLDEVKQWLEFAETRVRNALYNPRSRFLQRSAETDIDLVVFGTGVLFIGDKPAEQRLQFRCHHLRECYLCENNDGDIDTVFRVFKLTARQAVQQWGADKVGQEVTTALGSNKPDDRFEFIHVVMPRNDPSYGVGDNRPPRLKMPFASIWIERTDKHLLGEGGFEEFPYIVPRWDTAANEVYGRSPAMIALPDSSTLNQIGKTLLIAGHKKVNPPLLVPAEGMRSARRTRPGGQTYYDAALLLKTGGRPPVFPLDTGANIPLGREMQNDIRVQVQKAFFNDLLRLPAEKPNMTATEILERKEEYVRVVGPVFGRLEADYTGPIVSRVFNILSRAGVFGPPESVPQPLQGRNVRFEFNSPITRAIKQVAASAARKTLDDIAAIGGLKPDLYDNFDTDAMLRGIADANGVPMAWMHPLKEVAAMRDARAQAQAKAAQAQTLMEGMKTATPIIQTSMQTNAQARAANAA